MDADECIYTWIRRGKLYKMCTCESLYRACIAAPINFCVSNIIVKLYLSKIKIPPSQSREMRIYIHFYTQLSEKGECIYYAREIRQKHVGMKKRYIYKSRREGEKARVYIYTILYSDSIAERTPAQLTPFSHTRFWSRRPSTYTAATDRLIMARFFFICAAAAPTCLYTREKPDKHWPFTVPTCARAV